MGHTGAVRSIDFSNDGKQFLSTGFDKMVKVGFSPFLCLFE